MSNGWTPASPCAPPTPYLPLSGGTMTGPLVLAADPAQNLEAATKQYVDQAQVSLTGRLGDNRIINGDMRIDQRNGGNSGSTLGYTVDRWKYNSGTAGKGNWTRTPVTAPGFPYALAFVANSNYTPAAAEYFSFTQFIEADMVSDFAWGTPNAQPVTLSFWAFSFGVSGTFSGSLGNQQASPRTYVFTFALTAGVWSKVVIPISGDTAGTWVMSGNAAGLSLNFDLGTGAIFRGPAGAWSSNNYTAVTGGVSVVSVTNAQLNITGVKLEIGSVATPYNRQSLAKSMADCQWYYQRIGTGADLLFEGYVAAAGKLITSVVGYQAMRATPTAVVTGSPTSNNCTLSLFPGLQNMAARLTATVAGDMSWLSSPTGITLSAEL